MSFYPPFNPPDPTDEPTAPNMWWTAMFVFTVFVGCAILAFFL